MELVVSEKTLQVQGDNVVFTGDLVAAKTFVQQHHGTAEHPNSDGTLTEVLIGYGPGPVSWEDTAEYGRAETSDMAWRFALGAHFGPFDDEFEPFTVTVDPAN